MNYAGYTFLATKTMYIVSSAMRRSELLLDEIRIILSMDITVTFVTDSVINRKTFKKMELIFRKHHSNFQYILKSIYCPRGF